MSGPSASNIMCPSPQGAACTIAKVEAGQIVGSIAPPIAGAPGRDVFGNPIPPHKSERAFKVGRNLNESRGQLIAATRGNLRLNGTLLSIEALLELRDHAENAAIHNFDGDAVVKGSFTEGQSLQISGSLTVGGAIEAVQLKTGGSVYVKGGLIGKQKGKFIIGGDLHCRFISGGLIISGGDIYVQSEIIHGRISCAGRLVVARGPIYGGVVAANGGIVCQVLGHSTGTATIVEAGNGIITHSFAASTNAHIEANRKRVAEIRAKIEPLLEHMKQLTAPQREKATELLYEATELEEMTQLMVADLEKRTQALHEKEHVEVVVAEILYQGVTVRFPGIKATFSNAFKGPFTLVPRKTGYHTELVLIDAKDKTKSVLHSRPIHAAEAAQIAQTEHIIAA
jgi:uncharacterized protein (DUF342 family)